MQELSCTDMLVLEYPSMHVFKDDSMQEISEANMLVFVYANMFKSARVGEC